MGFGDTVKIAVDDTMPVGRCVVLLDGDIVYAGRIGKPAIPFMVLPDAVLILSPIDFADGEAFMKAKMH